MKFKILFLLFFTSILYNFCLAQGKILVHYEQSSFLPPQYARPNFIAELNVNDCSLKKKFDVDSLGIRGSWTGSMLLGKDFNNISILRSIYEVDYKPTLYSIDIKKKAITGSIEFPFFITNNIGFGRANYAQKDKILITYGDSLVEIDLMTKIRKRIWKSKDFLNQQGVIEPGGIGFGDIINGKYVFRTKSGLSEVDIAQDGILVPIMSNSEIAVAYSTIFCAGNQTCDTSIVYAIDYIQRSLYRLDLKNKTSKYLCKNDQFESVTSMQSQDAYLQIDCTPIIDLDNNDNSGKTKNDYGSVLICSPSVPVTICDSDLIVNSGEHIDSITCFILSGQKDANFEQLQCILSNNNRISAKGNASNRLTLTNKKWAKSLDFAEAVKQIRYVNNNPIFKKGERIIALQMYSKGIISDTAKAFLRLVREDAGRDSVVNICKKTPILLTDYLNNASNKNGKWFPNLTSGIALFNPQKDKFGKYLYIATGVCNSDTSIFQLVDYSNTFIKNIDTIMCFANIFKIKDKEYTKSGIYQEVYTYKNGCDSAIVNLKLTIRPENKSQIDTVLIEGQVYTINKENINKTGDYTIKLSNRFGCDSTINLKIVVKESDIKKYIPRVFIPDDNQIDNQVFKLLETAPIVKIKKLYIFNRWGEIVFKVENINHKDPKSFWDGTINNQKLPSDVYIYHLEIETAIAILPIVGEVALLR